MPLVLTHPCCRFPGKRPLRTTGMGKGFEPFSLTLIVFMSPSSGIDVKREPELPGPLGNEVRLEGSADFIGCLFYVELFFHYHRLQDPVLLTSYLLAKI